MKTNKKFYAFMLSLAMMLSAISPVFAAVVNYGDELTNMPNKNYTQKFSDVPASYWAFNYIAEMAERNVLSGYPDGKFYPNNNVTRAEFAKIMTAAAGLKISIGYSSYEDVNYTDWCSPYIEAARYYLSGYVSNGKSYYMPNNNALREDIAVALVKLKGYDTTGFDLSLLQTMFSDWKSISTGAQPYVAVAVEQELISGYDDGTFKPDNNMTRAEFTSALMRAAVITNPEAQLAEINFSDIDKSYWAYDDIAKAVSIGFISGYDDGTFRPADNVTYEQAITMIFHVPGYKPVADLYGGYPHAYMSLGYYNRFFKSSTDNRNGNIEMNETKEKTAITRRDAMDMLGGM